MENITLKIMFAVGILSIIVGLFLLVDEKVNFEDKDAEPEIVYNDITDEYYQYSFEELKLRNEHVIAKFSIEGLVHETVVHSNDNMDYTDKDIDYCSYGIGTVFMDYRNQIDDMNLILYGNTVFSEQSLRFGPLHQLTDQKIYQNNKTITLTLENEQRIYEIIAVVHFDLNQTDVDYAKTTYTEEEFSAYMEYISSINLIEPENKAVYGDVLLTLQTDIENQPDKKLVVVAKQKAVLQ